MRTIGILLGGHPNSVAFIINEIYNLEKKLAKVGYTAFLIRKGGKVLIPQSRFFFTRIPHPELLSSLPLISFSFPVSIRAQILANPAFRVAIKARIPLRYVSRIPNCILIKSRIPFNVSRIPNGMLVISRIPEIPFQTLFSCPSWLPWLPKPFICNGFQRHGFVNGMSKPLFEVVVV